MKVLVATTEQKEALEGTYADGAKLVFVKDANNNWVVNDRVISNGNFLEIREQLLELPQIDFNPKTD